MRVELERDGYLVLENALDGNLLDRLLDGVDRVYEEERAAGSLAPDGSLHLLGFLSRDPAFLELLDLPGPLSATAGLLGWNIYAYTAIWTFIRLHAVPLRGAGSGTRTAGARTSRSRPSRPGRGSRPRSLTFSPMSASPTAAISASFPGATYATRCRGPSSPRSDSRSRRAPSLCWRLPARRSSSTAGSGMRAARTGQR